MRSGEVDSGAGPRRVSDLTLVKDLIGCSFTFDWPISQVIYKTHRINTRLKNFTTVLQGER